MLIKRLKEIIRTSDKSENVFFSSDKNHINITVTDRNPFSTINNMMPSPEVIDYLYKASELSPLRLKLRIIFDAAVDKAKLQKVYTTYLSAALAIELKKLRRNTFTILLLLLAGAVIITLSFLLDSHFDKTFVEILSILGSFSIWEAADVGFFARHDIKKEIQQTLRLINAEWEQKNTIKNDPSF